MINGADGAMNALEVRLAQIAARAEVAMNAVAAALEGWAKTEHTYQDQSGDLSGSIRSYVAEVTPQAIKVLLVAGMPYAVFVERARSGKWAFLLPAVERHKDDITMLLNQILGD